MMAKYNEILVGRFNNHLKKHLSMKGDAPAPQLASELMPTLALHTDRDSLFHQGWNMFSVQVLQSPAAASFANLRLRNPLGSNIIAIIYRAVLLTTTADGIIPSQLCSGLSNADSATIISTQNGRWDGRHSLNAGSALIASTTAGASSVFPTQRMMISAAANGLAEFLRNYDDRYPLLPGDSTLMQGNSNGTVNTMEFWWMERFLEDSERF